MASRPSSCDGLGPPQHQSFSCYKKSPRVARDPCSVHIYDARTRRLCPQTEATVALRFAKRHRRFHDVDDRVPQAGRQGRPDLHRACDVLDVGDPSQGPRVLPRRRLSVKPVISTASLNAIKQKAARGEGKQVFVSIGLVLTGKIFDHVSSEVSCGCWSVPTSAAWD